VITAARRGQGLLAGWQGNGWFKSEKSERARLKNDLDVQKGPADNAWGRTERAPTMGRGRIVRKMGGMKEVGGSCNTSASFDFEGCTPPPFSRETFLRRLFVTCHRDRNATLISSSWCRPISSGVIGLIGFSFSSLLKCLLPFSLIMPQIAAIAPSALVAGARRLVPRQTLLYPSICTSRRCANSASALRTPPSECEPEAPKAARTRVPLNAEQRKFLDSAVRG